MEDCRYRNLLTCSSYFCFSLPNRCHWLCVIKWNWNWCRPLKIWIFLFPREFVSRSLGICGNELSDFLWILGSCWENETGMMKPFGLEISILLTLAIFGLFEMMFLTVKAYFYSLVNSISNFTNCANILLYSPSSWHRGWFQVKLKVVDLWLTSMQSAIQCCHACYNMLK